MVGKSTCGSGATGRNGNETMPTKASAAIISVVATGRRMNGSEMLTSHPRWRRRRAGAVTVTGALVSQLVLAVGDHAIAVIRCPTVMIVRVAGGGAGLDRTRLDGVVRLHHPGEQSVRPALHCERRNDDDVLAGLEQQPGIDEFARPQFFVVVGERRLEADRSRSSDRSDCRWSSAVPVLRRRTLSRS